MTDSETVTNAGHEPLEACLAYERADTPARVAAAAPGQLRIARAFSLADEPPDLTACSLLLLEQRDHGSAIVARARSFAAAGPELLLVMILPPGAPLALETALREAGVFDIVEDGPELPRAIGRTAAMVRHVMRLRAERARLASTLAHNDRLTAIGLLAAGVGHEINNPSAAILTNAESMREDLEGLLARPRFQQAEVLTQRAGRWLEALGDTIGAARRVTSIVRALNVFSRRTDENAQLEPTILNEEVATVIRLVGKEVRWQANLVLELDPDLPYVVAPPYAMTQVVTNLVVNALQALESGQRDSRQLRVSTCFDGESVMLEVADNGPGIPAEVIERVFDPFFTTKPAGAGTGLGLSITRELVRRSGGEIFVESEAGFGARFRVVLPRPARVRTAARPLSAPPPPQSRLRLLVVDDDELLLRAMARSLSDDFECTFVASGGEALEVVRRADPFDVMLSDVVMPEMDGLRLYDQIGDVDPRLAAHTLFFSGGLRSPSLQRAILDTGRPILTKPISIRDLARRIREVAAA